MARVTIEDSQLVISMKGVRKFFASPSLLKLTSEISVPLNNVTGVSTGINWKELPGFLDKQAGTDLDGFYYGGIFVQDGNKVFYDIKKKEEAVIITLKDEEFERIVIGVEDPNDVVEYIEKALSEAKV